MLALQNINNKKIKLDKLHIYIPVILICFCLILYFMVLTNSFSLNHILNDFYPASGNTGMGGQNPTPDSGPSMLGHNPNLDLNEQSNVESSNQTLKEPRLQENMAEEQHMTQDNLVAEQHISQDNLVAEQHMTQDNLVAEQHMTQNKDVWKQHGEEPWVQDLLTSVAKARTPDKKRKGFRRCRYADREKMGYKCHKK